MGSLFGGKLAEAGLDVSLVDVFAPAIQAINQNGLSFTDKSGATHSIKVKATTSPAEVGVVDLLIVFVKCYHTEEAVRSARPMIGAHTAVLTLQNGWGNVPKISALVGQEKVLAGVTYNSAQPVGLGSVNLTNAGKTFIGELSGVHTERLERIVNAMCQAGLATEASDDVIQAIWSKLALNASGLAYSALLHFTADEGAKHEGTMNLTAALLREVVDVANAQGIGLDYAERWQTISGAMVKAVGARGSMLVDVENKRRTEIDVINGAIVDAGKRLGIPTPYNEAMVWLVQSLQETF